MTKMMENCHKLCHFTKGYTFNEYTINVNGSAIAEVDNTSYWFEITLPEFEKFKQEKAPKSIKGNHRLDYSLCNPENETLKVLQVCMKKIEKDFVCDLQGEINDVKKTITLTDVEFASNIWTWSLVDKLTTKTIERITLKYKLEKVCAMLLLQRDPSLMEETTKLCLAAILQSNLLERVTNLKITSEDNKEKGKHEKKDM